jgi:ABC-2 type transport system permease protein
MIGVDMTALFVLSALFILAVSFLGILVSVLIPSQLKSTEILMIVASPSFILSGFTWPLSQMPVWVQGIAKTIPLTPYLSGFRKLFMLEGHFAAILPEISNLLWITVIAGIFSLLAVQLKIRQQLRASTMENL